MYRRGHRDQLSFEDFFLPFGGKLAGDNRWIKLAELIPWDDPEDDYAAHFCNEFGAPAKPFRMALGALIIKARFGLTDEELVEQIKENPYLQFFIGMEAFQYSAPFVPSMKVYFRKRLPESVVNDCNDRSVLHGLSMIRSSSADHHDDDDRSHGNEIATATEQQIESETTRPNQGSLLIDATCIPADIRYPTDLSLLNEARELTDTLIDAMHPHVRESFVHKPRTHRKQARKQFLVVAKKKRLRIKMIRKAIKQQLGHLKRNMASIDALNACGASLLAVGRHAYQKLMVISELVSRPRNLRAKALELLQDRICSRSPAERS